MFCYSTWNLCALDMDYSNVLWGSLAAIDLCTLGMNCDIALCRILKTESKRGVRWLTWLDWCQGCRLCVCRELLHLVSFIIGVVSSRCWVLLVNWCLLSVCWVCSSTWLLSGWLILVSYVRSCWLTWIGYDCQMDLVVVGACCMLLALGDVASLFVVDRAWCLCVCVCVFQCTP
jgi:hypothetical protein